MLPSLRAFGYRALIALATLVVASPLAASVGGFPVEAPDLRNAIFRSDACSPLEDAAAGTPAGGLSSFGSVFCEAPPAHVPCGAMPIAFDAIQAYPNPCPPLYCGHTLEYYDNVYGTPPPTAPWWDVAMPVVESVLKTYEEVAGVRSDAEPGEGFDAVGADRYWSPYEYLGPGNDLYFGTGENEWVDGGEGHDCIFLGGGHDRALGGPGNDEIHGQNGDDRIWGEDGHDDLFGGSGFDEMWGGDGYDAVHGGANEDFLFGDGGFDHVYGGSGADWIEGGDARDWLYGGTGDDFILGDGGSDYLYGEWGSDFLDGGADQDYANGGYDADYDACLAESETACF